MTVRITSSIIANSPNHCIPVPNVLHSHIIVSLVDRPSSEIAGVEPVPISMMQLQLLKRWEEQVG